DLVGSIAGSNDQVFWVPGTGGRTFGAGTRISFGSTTIQVTGMVVGNFGGDESLDIVVASTAGAATGGLFLLTNLGSTGGPFHGWRVGTPPPTAGTTIGGLYRAELNGDNKPDVVVSSNLGLVPVLSDGAGNWTVGTIPSVAIAINTPLAVGDLDGDGNDDVVLPKSTGTDTLAALSNV